MLCNKALFHLWPCACYVLYSCNVRIDYVSVSCSLSLPLLPHQLPLILFFIWFRYCSLRLFSWIFHGLQIWNKFCFCFWNICHFSFSHVLFVLCYARRLQNLDWFLCSEQLSSLAHFESFSFNLPCMFPLIRTISSPIISYLTTTSLSIFRWSFPFLRPTDSHYFAINLHLNDFHLQFQSTPGIILDLASLNLTAYQSPLQLTPSWSP